MSSETRNYKLAVLEIRPRLRSVNAFVLLNHMAKAEVLLESDSISIVLDNKISIIPFRDFKIVDNSLSSVTTMDQFITFRFATDNNLYDTTGGFKTELLQNTVASIESLSNKPLLSKNTNYVINCINCGKSVTDSMKFERILPLPSENLDPSDWFCHSHGNQSDFNLDPKSTDIFYTHCFVHINIGQVLNIKSKDKIVVCKFCLNWLGLKHNKNTLKLWHNTVKFVSSDTSIYTHSLADVFQSIKSILNHSLHNSIRLIVTCQTTSQHLDIILLWILEKKLQILFDDIDCTKTCEVAKVLFKFIQDSNEIYRQWQNDAFVNTISISKPMMTELLKHLHKFNKVLPKEFSKSNDFTVSYLFLYDQLVE